MRFFNGIQINETTNISHLFYADDVVFIGEWSDSNMENIVKILKCFFLASGLKINIQKSQVLGVGVPRTRIIQAASKIGCAVMQSPFRYLGVMVGDRMSRKSAWADTVQKLRSRLSKWKVKTLSIGGRLTLLKSVLGASPLYNMSIYKVPKGILNEMEMIRCNFFKGADPSERKISWVSWDKVLASKKNGGLGVSSFHALNRALLLKWVWRFLSQDGSLWRRTKSLTVASKIDVLVSIDVSLSWFCDLNCEGVFRVKEVRYTLDDIFLPSAPEATRWVKYIPIKINIFAWRARLDRLPTRSNLLRRGVVLDSSLCPICWHVPEDIFMSCSGGGYKAMLVFTRKNCPYGGHLDWARPYVMVSIYSALSRNQATCLGRRVLVGVVSSLRWIGINIILAETISRRVC
ncbi:RNA-directed DNA polymerase, eukaryota [Tanacetum coccineum]